MSMLGWEMIVRLIIVTNTDYISLQEIRGIIMHPIENKIVSRIYGKGRGWCFTPKYFWDLGSAESVRIPNRKPRDND